MVLRTQAKRLTVLVFTYAANKTGDMFRDFCVPGASAVLLAQLVHKIRTALKSEFDKQYLWSDSTVTLSWIRACPKRWKTFVANRVSEIQRLTNIEDWYHVRSKENPADIVSRGMSVEDLQNSELWWSGPYWLSEDFLQLESVDERIEDKMPEERTSSQFQRIA
ncbi:hypothetical protein QE152_g7950 [Popillia japonica]|uniref:Uncharacterized protein n=1 Tax=Popillia japonica TaxID=7064 RepID=A0AAW1MD54_POPJA